RRERALALGLVDTGHQRPYRIGSGLDVPHLDLILLRRIVSRGCRFPPNPPRGGRAYMRSGPRVKVSNLILPLRWPLAGRFSRLRVEDPERLSPEIGIDVFDVFSI